jgi:hypothetical protein
VLWPNFTLCHIDFQAQKVLVANFKMWWKITFYLLDYFQKYQHVNWYVRKNLVQMKDTFSNYIMRLINMSKSTSYNWNGS